MTGALPSVDLMQLLFRGGRGLGRRMSSHIPILSIRHVRPRQNEVRRDSVICLLRFGVEENKTPGITRHKHPIEMTECRRTPHFPTAAPKPTSVVTLPTAQRRHPGHQKLAVSYKMEANLTRSLSHPRRRSGCTLRTVFTAGLVLGKSKQRCRSRSPFGPCRI